MNEELLSFIKSFIEFKESSDNYNSGIKEYEIVEILKPVSSKNSNMINILSYEIRLELAKIYLGYFISSRVLRENSFSYFKNNFSSYANTYEMILSKNGYDCYVDVNSNNIEEYTSKYITKTENFHEIFLKKLYEYWDRQIELYGKNDPNEIQKVIETAFEAQCSSGCWFYYNKMKQNFLKVYLEYLKERNLKVNVFPIFKKYIEKELRFMEKGISHFTKTNLFNIVISIFDFYTAILDLYGENNKKLIDKLQINLNYIFKDLIEVEKMGFMNTFLYTKKLDPRNKENDYVVEYFWKKIYTNELSPTMKEIFINALIFTWNKSPIPKVRNSLNLIAKLATHNFTIAGRHYIGFPYNNQEIFYKDLIVNADKLKKSIKTILFSKAIAEEGGLF